MNQEKKSLFIIGNGFDLHHGLPTRYTYFIDFVELKYPEVYGWLYDSVKRYSLRYWDIIDKVDQGYVWNNMEELLGDFEPMEMVEEHRDWNSPKDYKGPPSEEIQKLLHFGLNINEYLNAWLKKVEKDMDGLSPLAMIKSLFKKEDLFLTFNYTRTLENVYNLENIFHIHGITGKQVVMGHGNGDCGHMYGDDFGINEINSKYIRSYFIKTNKNTKKIIKNNSFFHKTNFTNLKEIYIMGHSLNCIDMPYIKKILQFISSDIKLNIAYLDDGDKEYYLNLLNNNRIKIENINFIPWSDLD